MVAFLNRVLDAQNARSDEADHRRETLIAERKGALCLSRREEQLLRLELAEMPRKDIAAELGISEDAVKRVARSITEKANGVRVSEIAREIRAELLRK